MTAPRLQRTGRLRRCLRASALGFALLAAPALAAAASSAQPTDPAVHPEDQLQAAIRLIDAGDLGEATRVLASLTARQPNFRLAQLLYSQVLSLRSGAKIGLPLADEDDPRLAELLDELRARTAPAAALPAPGLVPDALLHLASEIRYAIVVDLSKTRLYLLENDRRGLHVVRSYYAAIARGGFGKQAAGDLRTPVGVYRITGWTPGWQLPQMYGAGALPVNYPNSWDRSQAKSGHGIWIHGVPATTYVRAPRSSEGCVTLANEDLLALQPLVAEGGTPVVLADRINWQPPAAAAPEREKLQRTIEAWRRAWSSLDTQAYLDFYASDFRTDDGMNKATFSEFKRRTNAGRKNISVKLSELSLFEYPGETGLVVAQFTQDYRSASFNMVSHKDQYWRLQMNGDWKIVREENH